LPLANDKNQFLAIQRPFSWLIFIFSHFYQKNRGAIKKILACGLLEKVHLGFGHVPPIY
jgi:hypothetical protein